MDEEILHEPRNRAIIDKRRRKKKELSAKRSALETVEQVTSRYEELRKAQPWDYKTFADLPLSAKTLKGLKENAFNVPTEIQRQSIGLSLQGKDVVGAAKTGSGKTLALMIPLLECLWRNRWTKLDGLGALVITPTRELAYQIFAVLNKVGKYHDFSAALVIGGTDVNYEKKRLAGMNIIVCTPGRLLHHMDENEFFSTEHLQLLVIDEADRILDMGFRKQMDAILDNLPKSRQTLLFSATQTRRVEDLVRVSLKEPLFVSAHEHAEQATPDQLAQSYLICEEEFKINFLWSFLVNHKHKKTLIFVTCCKQARFLTEALRHLRPGLPLMGLWGTQKQTRRMDVFHTFDQNTRGAALISTDVASRGLDFQNVDWVLQLDCPSDVDDYIHRVGRTARMERKGNAVLVLTPSQEEGFITRLKQRSVPISRIDVDAAKINDIRVKLSELMIPFAELREFAQSSFVAYVKAVHSQRAKDVFDVNSINFDELASSYGLPTTPRLRFLRQKHTAQSALPSIAKVDEPEVDAGTERLSGAKDRHLASGFDMSSDSEGDNDDFMKVTRRDVFDVNSAAQESANPPIISKALTTRQHARKALKKGAVLNKKVVFADDGQTEAMQGPEALTPNNLDLDEAQRAMMEATERDKKEHKLIQKKYKHIKKEKLKKRRKQDEEGDELDLGASDGEGVGDGPDLSWIPDPDRPTADSDMDDSDMDDARNTKNAKQDECVSFNQRKRKRRSVENTEEKALALLGLQ
ncbi:DEAD box protein (Asp-Glu-Ala-Asp) box polypeptide 10 [Aphelenchoides avenae]|nr:DEAD box protein (Asp-Glu-Ala-Asp) box polypeptide 10 [Aphelenchus avenae]